MKLGECVSSCITFLLLCMSDSAMSPLSTVKLFCDCLVGTEPPIIFVLWHCLTINIRWSPLVSNNIFYMLLYMYEIVLLL